MLPELESNIFCLIWIKNLSQEACKQGVEYRTKMPQIYCPDKKYNKKHFKTERG